MENTDQVNDGNNDKMSKIELGANNNSRTIIIILGVLLILSLLGVNFFYMIGNVLDKFFSGLKYYFLQLLTSLGFYSGAIINTTADVVGDTAKTGIDIAEGTVQSVGNLLQNRPNMGGTTLEQQQWNMNVFGLNPTPLDENNQYSSEQSQMSEEQQGKIQNINEKVTQFANKINDKKGLLLELDNEINERQSMLKSMPSENVDSELPWCPIGTEKNQGLCMQIGKNDKCMYGKTFGSKEQCEQTISKDSLKNVKKYDSKYFPNWGTQMMPPPPGALAPPSCQSSCQPLPGMCLQQKPMCGPMKQMPLQTMPSRGQIQQGLPPVSQQQQIGQQLNQQMEFEDSEWFECDNGEEIPASWENDGYEDCYDGSDETMVWGCNVNVDLLSLPNLQKSSFDEAISEVVFPNWCGNEVPNELELDDTPSNLPDPNHLYGWYEDDIGYAMARNDTHIWEEVYSQSACYDDYGGDSWNNDLGMCGWQIQDDFSADSTLMYEDCCGWARYELSGEYLFIAPPTPSIYYHDGPINGNIDGTFDTLTGYSMSAQINGISTDDLGINLDNFNVELSDNIPGQGTFSDGFQEIDGQMAS